MDAIDNLLGLIFALLLTIAILCSVFFEVKRTKELITLWIVFLILSLADIFFPALWFISVDPPTFPEWMASIPPEVFLSSILFWAIALLLFALGYFSVPNGIKKRPHFKNPPFVLHVKRVYLILAVSGGIYLAILFIEVAKAGSVEAYVAQNVLMRWNPFLLQEVSGIELFIKRLTPYMLEIFLLLVGVLFFYRHIYHKRILWGYTFPFFAWLLTLTTFFRGTQLLFFLALVVIEGYRRKHASQQTIITSTERGGSRFFARGTIGLIMIAVLLFFIYGGVRHVLTEAAYGEETSVSAQVKKSIGALIAGHGLIGFASVTDSYPDKVDYLDGKTFIDMALLPIPRAIYSSKPEWYGIDDITRGMGWPPSTQSAVTMPGELYANFGPVGIIFMVAFGAAFGIMERYRYHQRGLFIYAYIFIPCMLTSFWMSFTGVMNKVFPALMAFIFINWVLRKRKVSEVSQGEDCHCRPR